MNFTVIYEKITETNFPEGYYYAHLPTLDLTTHGLGIEGAKNAALDLIKLWIEEKKSNGEKIKPESESLYSFIELEDAILG
ncbi:MAG: type II toxin-antitoxin system HicB family antitoxin [Bacteroidota bacterium]|nr:type II toxin-antitoxin system HicB family antitoxin [Bacteroidota bacterium]